jgi:O-antigen/teichoic acid export membrane protein
MNNSAFFIINRNPIIKNIAFLFSGSAISQGMNAITLLLIARQLGPHLYGQYTSSIIFVTFFSFFFNIGLDIWLLHEGGIDPSNIAQLTGSIFIIKLIIGIPWLFLVHFITIQINSSALPIPLVQISAITILLNGLYQTLLTAFKTILLNKINSLLEIFNSISRLIGTLILINIGIVETYPYLLIQTFFFLISLLISLTLVINSIGFKPSTKTIRNAIRQATPYAASDLLAWLYMRQDILIIAFLLGDYATGIYSTATSIINALFLVPASIYIVIVPILSKLFLSEIKKAWKTAICSVGVLTVLGTVMFLILFLGSGYLVNILGESYRESQSILATISIIILIHSIIFGLAAILISTKQQKNRTIVQFIAVVINAGLNFLIVPIIGVIGVAYVYIISEIIIIIGYTWFVYCYFFKTKTEPNLLSNT